MVKSTVAIAGQQPAIAQCQAGSIDPVCGFNGPSTRRSLTRGKSGKYHSGKWISVKPLRIQTSVSFNNQDNNNYTALLTKKGSIRNQLAFKHGLLSSLNSFDTEVDTLSSIVADQIVNVLV